MEKRKQFLLDMDGVLSDFISGALKELNKEYHRDITIEQYAKDFGQWGTYDYYGITVEQFWKPIVNNKSFWINIQPYPWYRELYDDLKEVGDVTILTHPYPGDKECIRQKLEWLKLYLGLDSDDVLFGSRKYLLAGNGLLIDDYYKNVNSFIDAGGEAVLVPSNWNTVDISYNKVLSTIMSHEHGVTDRVKV